VIWAFGRAIAARSPGDLPVGLSSELQRDLKREDVTVRNVVIALAALSAFGVAAMAVRVAAGERPR